MKKRRTAHKICDQIWYFFVANMKNHEQLNILYVLWFRYNYKPNSKNSDEATYQWLFKVARFWPLMVQLWQETIISQQVALSQPLYIQPSGFTALPVNISLSIALSLQPLFSSSVFYPCPWCSWKTLPSLKVHRPNHLLLTVVPSINLDNL